MQKKERIRENGRYMHRERERTHTRMREKTCGDNFYFFSEMSYLIEKIN